MLPHCPPTGLGRHCPILRGPPAQYPQYPRFLGSKGKNARSLPVKQSQAHKSPARLRKRLLLRILPASPPFWAARRRFA